jgi:pimeloyl-ACP methyl ester carboxylesterase
MIAYQTAGTGAPLVLIHGLSGSGRWWAKNLEALARQFTVYIVDLIGFGRSRGRHPFVLGEAADYLARWLDRLGIERASVVGHSMGGVIALDLAARYPERADRMVLAAPPALPAPGYLRHVPGLLRALRHVPLGFLSVLAYDAARSGPRTLTSAAAQLLAVSTAELERVEAPSLLVWGEHDTLVPRAVGRELCQRLPRAEMVLVPGAGHVPMWERPVHFNQLTLMFLTARTPLAQDGAFAGSGLSSSGLTPLSCGRTGDAEMEECHGAGVRADQDAGWRNDDRPGNPAA